MSNRSYIMLHFSLIAMHQNNALYIHSSFTHLEHIDWSMQLMLTKCTYALFYLVHYVCHHKKEEDCWVFELLKPCNLLILLNPNIYEKWFYMNHLKSSNKYSKCIENIAS